VQRKIRVKYGGKILETIYSTFFTWCCFIYMHFC